MALMVELEGWVREAQDRLDAELGAVTTVGREQRSYLKKASTSQHTSYVIYLGLFGHLSETVAPQIRQKNQHEKNQSC